MNDQDHAKQGIVYALTNEAMPGLLKIGTTGRNDPQHRINELYTTGVPYPFECLKAIKVDDGLQLERALHVAFGPQRVNRSREFFEVEEEQVLAILDVWPGAQDVTPEVAEEVKGDIAGEEALVSRKRRRPNLDFHKMGIPDGSVLTFAQSGETVEVVSANRVRFQGEDISLTAATRKLGAAWGLTKHWTHQGRSVSSYYREWTRGLGF